MDLISSYIPVKRAGSSFKANCPFHNEKSPSFHIDAKGQRFKCFGCGEGGDAISFVMKIEGLSFVDTLRKLAAKANIPIIEEALDANAEKNRKVRGRLLDLHREAARFMHELLLTDPRAAHARNYLKSRGYNREMAIRWTVGWMPDQPKQFLDWAREQKFTGLELVKSGLCIKREQGTGLYVRFGNRLMFPVADERGEIIAFSGRQIIDDPKSGKYINSPETELFLKSKTIFAFDRARKAIMKQKAVLICEGQLDALACHEHGIDHAVATLGTACTAQHAKIFKRYTDTAILCFDADSAGYNASEKAFRELALQNIHVRCVTMPPGDDPDSFLKREGPDAFCELLDQARSFFDFKIDRAQATGGLANAQTRGNTAREVAALLAFVSDAVSRDTMLNHCATRLQMSAPDLRLATSSAKKKQAHDARRDPKEVVPTVTEPTAVDSTILYLCQLCLRAQGAIAYLRDQYETLHEAAQYLEGLPLLERIISSELDPSNAASVNTFLSGLPSCDQIALHSESSFQAELSTQPLRDAEEALSKLSEKVLNKRYAANKSALKQPGLSGDKLNQLLREATEITKLLNSLGRKTEADDRPSLGKSSKFEKKPFTRNFPNNKNNDEKKPWQKDG